jgi:small subunit ribosomal protein S21
MTEVYVGSQHINVALAKFKKKIQQSGLMAELRRRERYVKPSEAKKKKSLAARRLVRKYQEKRDEIALSQDKQIIPKSKIEQIRRMRREEV